MPLARSLLWLWDHTLNSVKFGISLLVLLALYVGVGSGLPDVRAYFELSDMEFFNAWPMQVLAMLLVANLTVVTFDRIPFTPPRYGVWTIHTGVIILVFGMVYYFRHKTEGMTLVRVGETVDWYYDAAERALYVKAGKRKAEPLPLPDLPRFETYAPQHGNDNALARRDLHGLIPTLRDYDPAQRAGVEKPIHTVAGLPGEEPLLLDVIAYYPYAVVGANYQAANTDRTGLRLTLSDPATDESRTQWLVAGDEGQEEDSIATLHLRHLHRDDALTGESLLKAARTAHTLKWNVAGQSGEITLEPGRTEPLGDTGYRVEAVEFLPSFPLFGSGEPVDTLELLIHPPADSAYGKTFRRYVLHDRPTQTDFILDAPGAGPKGQRQTEPVDPDLTLSYTHTDGLNLLPRGETERHTFLTKKQTPGLWQLVTSNTAPAVLSYREDGRLPLQIDGVVQDPETGQQVPYALHLDVERVDGVARQEWVQEVPPEQRDRNTAQSGAMQVITVRARRGDWEQIVQVPYTQWPDQQTWSFGQLEVPGAEEPIRLQLANTRKPMFAAVTLDRFELVPYAGDFTPESAMRDFRSHLTLYNQTTNQSREATAYLNSPVYYERQFPGVLGWLLPDESWLLYQNQWDPENQAFTVLGVGNRPGILPMTAGCVMIVVGLLWAFYVKPLIIQRNKQKALAAHAQRAQAVAA